MIRAIPSNASDNVYCTLLAQSAVHGAMAGYTGYTSGLVNGRQTYIPFYVRPRPPAYNYKINTQDACINTHLMDLFEVLQAYDYLLKKYFLHVMLR